MKLHPFSTLAVQLMFTKVKGAFMHELVPTLVYIGASTHVDQGAVISTLTYGHDVLSWL